MVPSPFPSNRRVKRHNRNEMFHSKISTGMVFIKKYNDSDYAKIVFSRGETLGKQERHIYINTSLKTFVTEIIPVITQNSNTEANTHLHV